MLEGETLSGLSSPSTTATPPPAKKMQEIDEIEESHLENSRNEVEFEMGLLHQVVDPVLVVDGEAMEGAAAVAELAFRCVAADKDDRPDAREVAMELRRIKGRGKSCSGMLRSSNSSNVVVPDVIG
ncbi:hypothetical protein SASPL_110543 [Salvia splendens]|uniref:Uncharacterized protein n=1 Tax=Salvia splendens TaxID=180675 RepID=A0A8X8Y511_SALSN|nr:hypothetical protein SASPL_110543 [Salvia splendens]